MGRTIITITTVLLDKVQEQLAAKFRTELLRPRSALLHDRPQITLKV